MFVAVLMICLNSAASSCTMVYHTDKSFLTLEACFEETDSSAAILRDSGVYLVEAGCLETPGQSI
jgi:hypothetical protein